MNVRAIHTPPFHVEGTPRRDRQEPSGTTQAPSPSLPQAVGQDKHPVLTAEEQRYFETLFPSPLQTLRPHNAYNGAGAQHQAVSGTLVDRKA